MNRPPKSTLLDYLERNPYLREELTEAISTSKALFLNYRWEQKINEHDRRRKSKERAYIELIVGKTDTAYTIRLCAVPEVTRNLERVQELLQEAASKVQEDLEKIIGEEKSENGATGTQSLTFHGYYLKGEQQEYDLGRIG